MSPPSIFETEFGIVACDRSDCGSAIDSSRLLGLIMIEARVFDKGLFTTENVTFARSDHSVLYWMCFIL